MKAIITRDVTVMGDNGTIRHFAKSILKTPNFLEIKITSSGVPLPLGLMGAKENKTGTHVHQPLHAVK